MGLGPLITLQDIAGDVVGSCTVTHHTAAAQKLNFSCCRCLFFLINSFMFLLMPAVVKATAAKLHGAYWKWIGYVVISPQLCIRCEPSLMVPESFWLRQLVFGPPLKNNEYSLLFSNQIRKMENFSCNSAVVKILVKSIIPSLFQSS